MKRIKTTPTHWSSHRSLKVVIFVRATPITNLNEVTSFHAINIVFRAVLSGQRLWSFNMIELCKANRYFWISFNRRSQISPSSSQYCKGIFYDSTSAWQPIVENALCALNYFVTGISNEKVWKKFEWHVRKWYRRWQTQRVLRKCMAKWSKFKNSYININGNSLYLYIKQLYSLYPRHFDFHCSQY